MKEKETGNQERGNIALAALETLQSIYKRHYQDLDPGSLSYLLRSHPDFSKVKLDTEQLMTPIPIEIGAERPLKRIETGLYTEQQRLLETEGRTRPMAWGENIRPEWVPTSWDKIKAGDVLHGHGKSVFNFGHKGWLVTKLTKPGVCSIAVVGGTARENYFDLRTFGTLLITPAATENEWGEVCP